jgi:pimeloyl-ACP methyl ester carboxylesterase
MHRDEFFDVVHSQELAKAMSAELLIIPNSGHNSPLDNPLFIINSIINFCL